MENRLDSADLFSRYDDLAKDLPVVPFVIATYGRFQDALLAGPTSLDNDLVAFKTKIFGTTEELSIGKVAITVFDIGRYFTLATVLRTRILDETNRPGLRIAIGILAHRRFARARMKLVGELLQLFFKALNERVGSSLPECGADELMLAIKAAERENRPVYQIRDAFDSLIVSARLLCECGVGWDRVQNRWLKWFKHAKYPRAVFYDQSTPALDVIRTIIELRSESLPKLSWRAAKHISRRIDIKLIPVNMAAMPDFWVPQSAEIRYSGGKLFVTLG
jgi:hypothetical protein